MLVELRRLFKNLLSLLTGLLFTRLFSFTATLLITRWLGPTAFGVFAFALSLALIFMVVANFGLEDVIVREVARSQLMGQAQPVELERLFGDGIALKSWLWPLVIGIALILGWRDPDHRWLYLVMMLYSLTHSYLLIICAIFRGLERMEFQTVLLTGQMLLMAAGAIGVVWFTQSATLVAVVYLLVTMVMVGVGYALLHRQGLRLRFQWQPLRWRNLFMMALPFGFTYITVIFYDRLAILLLALLHGETAVGLFGAVHNISVALATLPALVVSAVFPLLVRKREQVAEIGLFNQQLLKYVTLLSTALSAALYLAAPTIVPLFFGATYIPSVTILQVLALSIPLMFLSILLWGILEATGHQWACMVQVGGTFVVALLVATAAIWGSMPETVLRNAALAYVANHLLLTGVLWRSVHQRVAPLALRPVLLTPLLTGLAMLAVAYLGRDWSALLLLSVAGVVYTLIVVLNGALGRTEVVMMRKLLYAA